MGLFTALGAGCDAAVIIIETRFSTAGMAPAERVELMALTATIVEDRGISVLFTEHDMDVVFRHADRVLVLDAGWIVADGSPAEVRADPHVQAIYLGTAAKKPETVDA